MENIPNAKDVLGLKWGTLKFWDFNTADALSAAKAYFEAGPRSLSAMSQRDSAEQKQALCDLIDAVDCLPFNDWHGKYITKDDAKEYVLTYGEPPSPPAQEEK